MTLRAPLLWAGIALWLILTAAGFGELGRYATEPGPPTQAPAQWPQASTLQPPRGRPALLVFLHPMCPCSQATLEELNRLLADRPGRCEVQVVLLADGGVDWRGSANHRKAAALPGVRVTADPEGQEAARFAAQTSGQVLLYSADGHLLFEGGITPARGHMGDNAGADTLRGLLGGHPPGASAPTPVFGCPL